MADVSVPPLNYTGAFADVPNPTQSFTQGVQGGFAMQQTQLQQQMQQYQFQRMQQMQQASAQVAQNPTPENISQLSIAYPEMSEHFKQAYEMLQPAQQRAKLQHMSMVYAALQNGQPEIAAQLLNDRATALENSGGDPQEIASTRAMGQWAQIHPDTLKTAAGVLLASVMGPDKFGQTFRDVGEGQLTQNTIPAKTTQATAEASKAVTDAQFGPQKQQAEIANINSQVTQRSGQLALDRDKLMSDVQLKLQEQRLLYGVPSDDQRKFINDAVVNASSSQQSAARLTDLADRLEQVSKAPGYRGVVADAWKRATGTEDGVSAAKQEYARIVNNQALSGMKDSVGRVTDVEMKTAMGAVPGPNASLEAQTSYLRGVAKLQMLHGAMQESQAEWVNKGGRAQTLGPAVRDMDIMGTHVAAGTTYAEFARNFLPLKAQQVAAQFAVARAKGSSYAWRLNQPAQTGGATGTWAQPGP